MIKLTINGLGVSVEEGTTLLEAARFFGFPIPTLCHNDGLTPLGACRLCVVEIGEEPRTNLVSSCTYPAEEGLKVRTASERVIRSRRMIIELLLASCPQSKIIQDLASAHNVRTQRFKQEYEDCILCGLCVRMCAEQMMAKAIGFRGRGENRSIGTPFDIKSDVCRLCGGCIGMCEIGKSAYRGHEVIYPQPFGVITTAAEKEYPVDYSHFNIMGTAVGAKGIEADSDKAIFPAVKLEVAIGHDKGIKFRYPWLISGIGSTNIAKNNWEGLAIGSALTGTGLTIGENVVGMDPDSVIKNGRVCDTVDLKRRVKLYQEYQSDGYGAIIVQANIEDTRLGTQEYAIEKLGVECVELKWGQGAKDIGGEVKIKDLKKAQMLQERGYIILPSPTDENVIQAFERGMFKEFERHSRVGMVSKESFAKRVEELRKAGAKYIFLKTGAYRPADLARAVLFTSKYKLDLLTVDGAGGGTGMSPWRMMNEWGIPPVELHSLLYRYAKRLTDKGKHIPAIAVSGGFAFEDQIFKGLAIGAPFVKLIGMARGPIAAAMVGKTIGKAIDEQQIPVYIERFGDSKSEIFITASSLRKKLGNDQFEKVPTGALGLYTYYERLAQGLRQIMAGSRKFSLEYISRNDIAALTHKAAEISGIKYVMDTDISEVEKILS